MELSCWVGVLALPVGFCVSYGKLLNICVLQYKMRWILLCSVAMGIEWRNKVAHQWLSYSMCSINKSWYSTIKWNMSVDDRINQELCRLQENWHLLQRQTGFPGGASGKEPTYQCRRRETQVQALGREWQEGMAAHSSIHAWRIPWTEEPSGLWSIGSQSVGHDWLDLPCTHRDRRD